MSSVNVRGISMLIAAIHMAGVCQGSCRIYFLFFQKKSCLNFYSCWPFGLSQTSSTGSQLRVSLTQRSGRNSLAL